MNADCLIIGLLAFFCGAGCALSGCAVREWRRRQGERARIVESLERNAQTLAQLAEINEKAAALALKCKEIKDEREKLNHTNTDN